MTRYRRGRLDRGESVASAVVAGLLGAGTAAVVFYVTRLMLAREPLAEPRIRGRAGEDREPAALPAGGEPSADGLAPDKTGGHDPGR